jgi:iron complex outermembrane recepter protein
MKFSRLATPLSTLVAFTSCSVLATNAFGQLATDTIDEVVVTARFTSEQVIDLPFTVNVINGDELEQRRLTTLEEALRGTVGVDVSSFGGFNDSNVRIRGVGSLFQISAEDSSVVMNVDGVPLSSRNATLGSMDIARVEILKGPQGTLFGRNSEAGAINIATRRPTREFKGDVRTEYGQDDQYLAELAIGGPLSNTLSSRIAIRASGADSVLFNQSTGKPTLTAKDLGGRVSLLWQPSDSSYALWISERHDQNDRVGLEALRPHLNPPVQDITPGIQHGANVQDRHSLEIDHRFSGSRLSSISSYTSSDTEGVGCQGKTLTQFYGLTEELCQTTQAEHSVINQDLRWLAREDAAMFWLAGLNLSRSKRQQNNAVVLFGSDNRRWFDTDSGSLYGEVTYPITQSLKLTGGLRHTRDAKDYRAEFHSAFAPTTADQRELSDNYSTGRVAVMYAINDSFNLYSVFARGYKSGGFIDYASQVADGEPLKPAIVNNVEAGAKSIIADGKLTLNAAAFLNKVKDDHLLGYDVNTFASKGLNTDTTSKGIELETIWQIVKPLSLMTGVNFTQGSITRTVLNVSGGDVMAGNRIPDAARISALARITYTAALPDFAGLSAPQLNTALSYRYLGRRAVDPQNHFDLPANRKIDLRIGIELAKAEFYAWGDNLLDEPNELYGYYYAPGISTGMTSRGRTLGVGINYQF